MNVGKFETANGWFSEMHAKGYKIPVTLCQAIEGLMKTEKISFPKAYGMLESKKRIVYKDTVISFK